jgi:hypothetical protein
MLKKIVSDFNELIPKLTANLTYKQIISYFNKLTEHLKGYEEKNIYIIISIINNKLITIDFNIDTINLIQSALNQIQTKL